MQHNYKKSARRYAFACLTILAIFVPEKLHAQLTKEITINREIEPEVKRVVRPDYLPATLSFTRQTVALTPISYTEASQISPSLFTLDAAPTERAIAITPYRNYLDLSYFPTANLGLSVGTTPISKANSRLSLNGQLGNTSYKGYPTEMGKSKKRYQRLWFTIGADFWHKVGDAGCVVVATDFGFRSVDNLTHLLVSDDQSDEPTTTLNKKIGTIDWGISAGWHGHNATGLKYNADVRFGLFNFSTPFKKGTEEYLSESKPVHQRTYGVSLGASQTIGERSLAGVNLIADLQYINHYRSINRLQFADVADYNHAGDISNKIEINPAGKTFGVFTLNPYYKFTARRNFFTAKIGALLQLERNTSTSFRIAPDLKLALNPASGLGVWLHLGGGAQLNYLQNLIAFAPYASPLMAYATSHIPVKGDFGLRFGPLYGASVTIDVAYAAADSWLMPACSTDCPLSLIFSGERLRSWKAGVSADWQYKNVVALRARYEVLLSRGNDHAWIEWLDRSTSRLSAQVSVRPISALTIDLGYTLAIGRAIRNLDAFSADLPATFSLKNSNNLSVGASYAISSAVTVVARAENILDNRSYLCPGVPQQGFTGAVGFGWKF